MGSGQRETEAPAKAPGIAGTGMNTPTTKPHDRGPLHQILYGAAVAFAYIGGAVVAAIGIMSAVHIIGLWLFSSPVRGDFELVEFGIAIAGTLFLPYCQATRGHIIVDFFTQRASPRTLIWLDSFGSLLMAIVLLLVGWRTAIAIGDMYRNGETTTLRGLPIWIAYAGMAPGFILAGLIALAQSMGVMRPEQAPSEVPSE